MSGYLDKKYAQAMNIGKPVKASNCDAWLIERDIDGSKYKDLTGCYPLFVCRKWENLERDIMKFSENYVSVSFVADPLGGFIANSLKEIFRDVFFQYKTHLLVDLSLDIETKISKTHLRNAKKAISNLHIVKVEHPFDVLNEWIALYKRLIERHSIKGVATFSKESFELQFKTTGLHVFAAYKNQKIVGMVLFYTLNDNIYYHLAAYDETGYTHNASFGIFLEAIKDFKDNGFKYLNLGGSSGHSENQDDGLYRFKKGWSTDQAPAYFCGKILNTDIYSSLTSSKNNYKDFFPAYRNSF